jgi:hypothetical protein
VEELHSMDRSAAINPSVGFGADSSGLASSDREQIRSSLDHTVVVPTTVSSLDPVETVVLAPMLSP